MQLSTSTPTVRLYAHCLNPTSQHYKQGGVVMYGMNVGDKGASVSLQPRLNETQILEMILQPPEGDLQSSSVMLNGVLVELTSDNDLPSLDAHPSDVLGAIHMPAQSMGFWLLPNAKTQACH
ncbi:unnamed protein product [Meganyctiphanes norvegica]|uniref:Uncharacterized protein n=1 Tax=Meganyctiphanes norvegica TaxID=48144 RepID=A0AAV2RCM5_MEGNR